MATARFKKPTALFKGYVVRMAFRFCLFLFGVYLLIANPDALDPAQTFGIPGGFNFIDLCFLALVADALTKFFPSADISMGSLKQYGEHLLPSKRILDAGIPALREFAKERVGEGVALATEAAGQTIQGAVEAARQVESVVDLRNRHPELHQITLEESFRRDIRSRRFREILPVIIFWVVFNAAIALALDKFGWLNAPECMVWVLFFFLFDMVCVVLWCPIQIFMMRNRCCTTCQIFNWDAIMAATPLIFVGGWFSWLIILLALLVLIRWELAFIRHPERFDERANRNLSCANCKDGLCYLRQPFIKGTRG